MVFLLKDAAKLRLIVECAKILGYSASICDERTDTKGNKHCFNLYLRALVFALENISFQQQEWLRLQM